MSGRTSRRVRGGLIAAGTLLLTAPALISNPAHFPGAVLAAGSDFTLSGSVSNLAPGVSSTLVLSVDNPQAVAMTVTRLTVTVTADPAGCSAVGNLTLNGSSFSGNPPAVTISGSPLPQLVGKKTGSTDGSATISLPIAAARTSGNSCQTASFPFSYNATATYTAATSTTLASSPNPSMFGQPATFTATVTASPSDANPAVGSVAFYRCTSPANLAAGSAASACTSSVSIGPAQAVNNSDQAALTTSSLPPGSLPIFATFTPTDSTNYTSSSSTILTQTIGFTQPCVSSSVNGGYSVGSGQSLCLTSGAKVNGGVTVSAGGSLYLSGGTVNGSLNASHGGALTVCGSTINGGASISNASGFVMVGDAGDDGAPACAANTIKGGITISNGTGSFEVGGNSITGGATFTGNTGAGPFGQDATPEIEQNTITGGLACSSNNPAPTNGGQPNSVSGSRSGQCVAGSF